VGCPTSAWPENNEPFITDRGEESGPKGEEGGAEEKRRHQANAVGTDHRKPGEMVTYKLNNSPFTRDREVENTTS